MYLSRQIPKIGTSEQSETLSSRSSGAPESRARQGPRLSSSRLLHLLLDVLLDVLLDLIHDLQAGRCSKVKGPCGTLGLKVYPEGASTQHFGLLLPKAIHVMGLGTRIRQILGSWTLWGKMPALKPQVCKQDLFFAIWSPRAVGFCRGSPSSHQPASCTGLEIYISNWRSVKQQCLLVEPLELIMAIALPRLQKYVTDGPKMFVNSPKSFQLSCLWDAATP